MTDQQREDTIGMSVGGEPVTPTLTRLAAESVRFENAYNACPLCVPARTALATGVAPLNSGMFLNDLKGDNAPNLPTIHKMLHDAGYEIAHIGVNHITVQPPLKNALNFAAWQDDDTYAQYAKDNNIKIERNEQDVTIVDELCNGEYLKRPYSNANVTTWQYDLNHFKDVWFCNRAIDFINQKHTKPFALFVCLWAPHPPLKVPEEYLKMFPAQNFTLPQNTEKQAQGQPKNRKKGAAMQLGSVPPKNGWAEAWSAHCALTRLCDDRLSLLLKALKDNDLAENTLTVVTTDHGEQLGQHGMYQKMEMYEPAVRVPAIFNVPKTTPKSYKTPISHLDFVPTVLDLLNINSDKYALEGRSHLQSIENLIEPKEQDVFSVYCGNHSPGDMRRMVVRNKWKYVYDGIEAELYNLENDSLEMINLAYQTEYSDICQSLHNALENKWKNTYDTVCYEKGETDG